MKPTFVLEYYACFYHVIQFLGEVRIHSFYLFFVELVPMFGHPMEFIPMENSDYLTSQKMEYMLKVSIFDGKSILSNTPLECHYNAF